MSGAADFEKVVATELSFSSAILPLLVTFVSALQMILYRSRRKSIMWNRKRQRGADNSSAAARSETKMMIMRRRGRRQRSSMWSCPCVDRNRVFQNPGTCAASRWAVCPAPDCDWQGPGQHSWSPSILLCGMDVQLSTSLAKARSRQSHPLSAPRLASGGHLR